MLNYTWGGAIVNQVINSGKSKIRPFFKGCAPTQPLSTEKKRTLFQIDPIHDQELRAPANQDDEEIVPSTISA